MKKSELRSIVREHIISLLSINRLVESSLSRIWKDYQETQFSIVTAWRVSNSKQENTANLRDMMQYIRKNGLGFVRIDGVGQEEDASGKIVSVKEPALLVKNIKDGTPLPYDAFTKIIYDVARKHNQWGVVMHNPTSGTELVAFKDDDGSDISPRTEMSFNKFSPMKTAQFFSSLKGKPFMFEGFKYGTPPESHVHGMAMQSKGHVDIYRYETLKEWKSKFK